MNNELVKKNIYLFLKQHLLCVIATIHPDGMHPESAVVAFSETEQLEIVIGTSSKTRKYNNLQKNSNVALVIGWDSAVGTVQYEGIAKEISLEDAADYAARHIKKNPGSAKYANNPDQRYFLITPQWIRFTDNAGERPGIYEISLI